MRANTAVENVSGRQMAGSSGAESGGIPHHLEFCYNNIRVNNNDPNDDAFMMSNSDYYQGQAYGTWIYRNTVSGGDMWIRFQGADLYHVDGNVVSANLTARFDTSIIDSLYEVNLVGTVVDGLMNDDNTLTDSYAQYHGLRGHVLAEPQ